MKIIDLSGEYTEKCGIMVSHIAIQRKILRVSIKMAISQENIH